MLSPLQAASLTSPPLRSARPTHAPTVGDSFVPGAREFGPGRPSFAPSPDLTRMGKELAALAAGPVARLLVDGAFRPSAEAVAFVGQYNADLKLGPASMAERQANMTKSPATFFRMFPSLFHADMRGPYAEASQLLDRPAPRIVINGDSHLGNYGTLRDDVDGVKWALNDYDQAGPGSPERDLVRLTTSIVLLGQENGLSHKESVKMARRCAESYLKELAGQEKGAGLSEEEAWGPVKDLIQKAAGKTHAQMVEKFATEGPEGWALRRNEELVEAPPGLRQAIVAGVRELDGQVAPTPGIGRPFEILDVCLKKGSGGSSRGLERYYVLLGGVPEDPLPAILEIKQILPCPIDSASGDLSLGDPAQVVSHQAALGGPENPLNAEVMIGSTPMLAREREGEKLDLKLEKLSKSGWEATVEQAGQVLAQAHAYGQGQSRALHEWIGADGAVLVERLTALASHYAAQTQADFAAVTAA